MVVSHLRGKLLIIWIPAFAGMTDYLLMNYPGLCFGQEFKRLADAVRYADFFG